MTKTRYGKHCRKSEEFGRSYKQSKSAVCMDAIVWHGVGDILLEQVPEPGLKRPTDAIVRLTASAICGTDLHFIRVA